MNVVLSQATGDGASSPHIPVLLDEVLGTLGGLESITVIDCTFGAGGYSKAFLDAGATVIAFDRDPDAIQAGQVMASAYDGRLMLVEAAFSQMAEELEKLNIAAVDAVVMDIGVSSMQLDQAARGFAFRHDGPLDMRMEQSGPSAADIINSWSESDLAALFFAYGEERRSRAIARLICEVRGDWPIETTRGLATLIEKLMPMRGRRKGQGPVIHPATRVFQALRIAVNDELFELIAALHAAEGLLKPGGRLSVVTFHSLEDRIVKRFFASASHAARGSRHLPDVADGPARFDVLTRRPIVPGDDEMAANPRARSAKLRAGVRTLADAQPMPMAGDPRFKELGLPKVMAVDALRENRGQKPLRRGEGDDHADR
ncbi:MAG: 16S rRNA (cytosine(1402)-N(4))-methyltransferase RsmH [Pseudomonadota bacterium]